MDGCLTRTAAQTGLLVLIVSGADSLPMRSNQHDLACTGIFDCIKVFYNGARCRDRGESVCPSEPRSEFFL